MLVRRRLVLGSTVLMLAAVSTLACGGKTENTETPSITDLDSGGGNPGDNSDGTDAGGQAGANPDEDGGGTETDAGSGSSDTTNLDGFTCPGGTIASGKNEGFKVGGKTRAFLADFPSDTSKPWAVVFSWHGFGDEYGNFHDVLKFDPNTDPNVPAVVITPEDTKMLPPVGLGWDIKDGTSPSKNIDLAFFEAILGCLKAQQKIDATRIYSFGFSAGAVMTNMIHSRYPKLVPTVVTESGAWFNDKEETKLVNLPGIAWNWPALDPVDRGNVLLTHGGSKDVTALNLLDLEKSAQAAVPFLLAAQRTVIDCKHDLGHHLHPDLKAANILSYLFAHRLGQPSPFKDGQLTGYPGSCTLHVP